MHVDYWGLDHSPFASQLNPDDYYASSGHEEALARLEFLISHGRRLGYLLGASGTGKSLLLEVAARQLRRAGCQVVSLNAVGVDGPEFIWKLATGLGHLTSPNATAVDCWRGITDRLIANRYQRLSTVFLIDDADDANPDVLSALSRLALIDQHPEAKMTLVLAAQRQRTARFGSKLQDICELRIDLEPWDLLETRRYMDDVLERAGATREIFDQDSVEHLQQLSRGIPRRIRQLAELSLLAAAAEELELITASVIESVHRSLTNDGIVEAV